MKRPENNLKSKTSYFLEGEANVSDSLKNTQ